MLATTESRTSGLFFKTEGTSLLSDKNWNDISLVAQYGACAFRVGLTPRYLNDNFYLASYVENTGTEYKFYVESYMRGTSRRYVEVNLSSPTFPMTIKTEVKGTYFTFYVNDTQVHYMEFSSIPEGKTGLYAGANEQCESASINEPQAVNWITNATNVNTIIKQDELEDETQLWNLTGLNGANAKIWRTWTNLSGSYTLSFLAYGNGEVLAQTPDGTTTTTIVGTGSRMSVPITLTTVGTLTIAFQTKTNFQVGEVQLEAGAYATSYIPNTSTTTAIERPESILTFPASGSFSSNEGTMYLSYIPKQKMPASLLFTTDTNEFQLRYTGSAFTWKVADKTVTVNLANWTTKAEIICEWSERAVALSVNGTRVRTTGIVGKRKQPKVLSFTEATKVVPIVVDDVITWSESLGISTIEDLNDLPSPANIMMKATFRKAIAGKGVSWFELPVAPFDASPILVEKEDGTNMQKVSFFDIETGKYRTYNEELFVYDGKSDYVEVAFKDVNEDFFDLMIRTEEGEKIGEPYRIEGKRVYFSLSALEKKDLNRKQLYARYQLNDSYTVDYNISAVDGYRIDFAKHDGQEKTVYQEGNRWGEAKKLATMIEMNPILNQNHEGFLYLTNNQQVTSSFKVTITPEHILADGGSSAIVIVEPVDKDGNFIPCADLDVRVKQGRIHRIVSTEAAEAQKRSGIYLYMYYAPFIGRTNQTRNVDELVWIVDKDAHIGIQYDFLLKPTDTRHPIQFTSDAQQRASRKSRIFNALLLYEGLEETDDAELFNILDLDKNGKVTLEDIAALESGQLDGDIPGIFTKLENWEGKQ